MKSKTFTLIVIIVCVILLVGNAGALSSLFHQSGPNSLDQADLDVLLDDYVLINSLTLNDGDCFYGVDIDSDEVRNEAQNWSLVPYRWNGFKDADEVLTLNFDGIGTTTLSSYLNYHLARKNVLSFDAKLDGFSCPVTTIYMDVVDGFMESIEYRLIEIDVDGCVYLRCHWHSCRVLVARLNENRFTNIAVYFNGITMEISVYIDGELVVGSHCISDTLPDDIFWIDNGFVLKAKESNVDRYSRIIIDNLSIYQPLRS